MQHIYSNYYYFVERESVAFRYANQYTRTITKNWEVHRTVCLSLTVFIIVNIRI